MSDWRPIKTYPRPEKNRCGIAVMLGAWFGERWWTQAPCERVGEDWRGWWPGAGAPPTHWQPLPAPPDSGEGR